MSDTSYLISEASKKAGVEPHVLRYWEEELSLPIARNEMGHRYYTKQDIQIFLSIKELKRRGFQLKMIKELIPKLEKTAYIEDCASGDTRGTSGAEDKDHKEQKSQKNPKKKSNVEKLEHFKDKQKGVNQQKIKSPAEPGKAHTPSGVKVVVHRKDLPVKAAAEKKEDSSLKVQVGNREVSRIQGQDKAKEQSGNKVKEQMPVKKAESKNEKVKKGQAASGKKNEEVKKDQEKLKSRDHQDEFYQIMERLIQQLAAPNRSEERYKRLDAAIRKHQYSRRLVAATEEQSKKRKKKYTK